MCSNSNFVTSSGFTSRTHRTAGTCFFDICSISTNIITCIMAEEFLQSLPLRMLGRDDRLDKIERETRCQITLRAKPSELKRLNTQPQSPLCRLPPELKNTIYELLFTSGTFKLLSTCRIIWLESHSLALHMHTFDFSLTGSSKKRPKKNAFKQLSTQIERMQKFFGSLTLRNRVEVNTVRLHVNCDIFHGFAQAYKVSDFFGGSDRVVYAKELVISIRHKDWPDLAGTHPESVDTDWLYNLLDCNALRILCKLRLDVEVQKEDDHLLYPIAERLAWIKNESFLPASTTDFLMKTYKRAKHPNAMDTEVPEPEFSRISVIWNKINGTARSKMQKELEMAPGTKPKHELFPSQTRRGGRRASSGSKKTPGESTTMMGNARDPKQQHMWEALSASAAYQEKWDRNGSLLTLVAEKDRRPGPKSDYNAQRKIWRQQERERKKLKDFHR